MKIKAASVLHILLGVSQAEASSRFRGNNGNGKHKGHQNKIQKNIIEEKLSTIVSTGAEELEDLFKPATWKITAWNTGTDDAWNLCNGLGKKNECTTSLVGTDLPFAKCQEICGGGAPGFVCTKDHNQELIDQKVWDLEAEYPIISDGPENTAEACGTSVDNYKEKSDYWVHNVEGNHYCIPSPATSGGKVKILAATGHGLGICGDLFLFTSPQDADWKPILAQFQVDTRAWSFESSAEGWGNGPPPFCPPDSACYAGAGCVQPRAVEKTLNWDFDVGNPALPIGWTLSSSEGDC